MGKKLKVGKSRKDKFYKLSKEIGYRSRAAFKLIQLNQKYSFLQNSSVLLDLCCAPGGWLQVAAKTMAASSLIIGIDLVPIKPLPNVELIQEDITTDKCYSMLKRFLKTCKLDCVLHDGAPNLGNNWLHDAHSQVRLTFYAFKLAVNFLAPGGWFVTKLFRSKDYNSMIWLFQKFFRKVESTKPQASRNESAEIYVICQGFIRYDKVDAKFLDPKFIFQEVDDIILPSPSDLEKLNETKEANSEEKGLPEGLELRVEEDKETKNNKFRLSKDVDNALISDVDFIQSSSHKQILAKEGTVNEVLMIDPRVRAHPLTTPEIRELCSDLQVMGKGDVRTLTRWALKLKKDIFPTHKPDVPEGDKEPKMTEDEIMEKMVQNAKTESEHLLKLKRRKVAKERLKLAQRMQLKMDLPHEVTDTFEDEELFDMKRLAARAQPSLPKMGGMEEGGEVDQSDDSNEDLPLKDAPLMVDLLPNPRDKKEIKMEQWFDRPSFKYIKESDQSENSHGKVAQSRKKLAKLPAPKNSETTNTKPSGLHENGGSTARSDDDLPPLNNPNSEIEDGTESLPELNGGISGECEEGDAGEDLKLQTAEEMTLGAYMVQSKKKTSEMIDWSYHRYTFGDKSTDLPDWFVTDERKHYFKRLPEVAMDPETLAENRARLRAIDARPIKKVIEARARKKGRLAKRLSRALQRAERMSTAAGLNDTPGQSAGGPTPDAVKQRIIAKYAQRQAMSAKRDKVYVVAHGRKGGARAASERKGAPKRNKNVKVKRVDRRMKKDNRAARVDKKKKGKKSGKKGATSFGKRRR